MVLLSCHQAVSTGMKHGHASWLADWRVLEEANTESEEKQIKREGEGGGEGELEGRKWLWLAAGITGSPCGSMIHAILSCPPGSIGCAGSDNDQPAPLGRIRNNESTDSVDSVQLPSSFSTSCSTSHFKRQLDLLLSLSILLCAV